MRRRASWLAAVVVALASPALADIDTSGLPGAGFEPFGSPDTATYGQTFTAGAGDRSIRSFSLFRRHRLFGETPLRSFIMTGDSHSSSPTGGAAHYRIFGSGADFGS